MVRHWGFYTNAAHGSRLKALQQNDTTRAPPGTGADGLTRHARLSWATMIRCDLPLALSRPL